MLKSQGKSLILSKSVKTQGILFSLRTKSREKCKEFEDKDRNIDGLPKKPKQMYINTDFSSSSSSSSSSRRRRRRRL